MKFEKIGSLVSISKGKKHNVSEFPGPSSKRMLGIDDLRNDNLLRYTDDSNGVEAFPDDVLIAWDGANAGTIGYGKSGLIGSTIARLRLRDISKYFPPFLGILLQSQFDYLRKTATGATIPHINRSALDDIVVPDFNREDQVRIAHLLGKVEGLIAQRKKDLSQLDQLLKSVFLEMFGDPVRNEKGWEKPPLSKFGKISTGNTPPRIDPENYTPGIVEWIKTDNIPDDSVYLRTATESLSHTGLTMGRTVNSGALLIACIAGSVESIGRAALTNRSVAFNQQINAIQPNQEVNPFYLYVLFKILKKYIQSHATKGMKKILTKGDFEKILMIKPPIDVQNRFATIVEKVEILKVGYKTNLVDLETLYGVLSQKAFQGELDLSRISMNMVAPIPQPLELDADPSVPTPDVTHVEFEADSPRHAFTRKDIESVLKKLGGPQSFPKLLAELERITAINRKNYDGIRTLLYQMLSKKQLAQVFDESQKGEVTVVGQTKEVPVSIRLKLQ